MNYKAIIPSQNIRFHILKLLRFVPDKIMLSLQYYIKMGKMCNFRRPTTWTEKLQLYKMLYRNPLLGACVDKYMVIEYIKQQISYGYINKDELLKKYPEFIDLV